MATPDTTLHLRLYIAGNAPHSVRARENLAIICHDLPQEQLHLEVIDVLREPMRALQDKIFVTPVLYKLAPPPEAQIVGDLSDLARVRLALGLGKEER
ncbi:MAG: circadian clock KaiB family protein [Armatimonadota bacterium]